MTDTDPSPPTTDETPPWLDAAQLTTWVTLMAFMEHFPADIEAQLKRDSGLNRFEYTVMAMLSEHDGHELAMSDLAGVAFGSLSRLSHAVTRLEARGWVEREPGSGGRRHNVVRLTDDGLAAMQEASAHHVRHVDEVFVQPLTDDEVEALGTICAKLLRATSAEVGDLLDRMIPEVVARNLDG